MKKFFSEEVQKIRNELDGTSSKSGKVIKSSAENFLYVFSHDPLLINCIGFDRFNNRLTRLSYFDWNDMALGETGAWSDADDDHIQNRLEMNYDLKGDTVYKRTLSQHARKHAFHPVRDYLNDLPEWDNVPRAFRLFTETLLIDDTEYSRAVIYHWLLGAVARIFHPGCKFDYCLVLKGAQGIGKSTIFNFLGGKWFNDSVGTLDGKDVMEQIQGSWIIELGELQATNKSDNEQIKAFLSRQVDKFRTPYGRRTEEYPRQCVFAGTTNSEEFLRDRTGSRRFWVLVCNAKPDYELQEEIEKDPKKSLRWRLHNLNAELRDKVWAEVMYWYRFELEGRDGKFDDHMLDLPDFVKADAAKIQEQYTEGGELEGAVSQFLETRIPPLGIWDAMTKLERRGFLNGITKTISGDEGSIKLEAVQLREKVCAAEILYEGMNIDNPVKERSLVRQVNELLAQLPDWERATRNTRFSEYGAQRVSFKRRDSVDIDC